MSKGIKKQDYVKTLPKLYSFVVIKEEWALALGEWFQNT
jgi:hypothetical protein